MTESNDRNDWEMMGADIKNLQNLIESLEKIMQEEKNKQEIQDKNKDKIVFENVIN